MTRAHRLVARDAEAISNAAQSPAALEPLAAHGAAVVFCERPGRPLPAVVRLNPPCLEGVFVDEDELHESPPTGDLFLVSRRGDVQMWSGGELVEDPPSLASVAIERVGGFSTGPVLRVQFPSPRLTLPHRHERCERVMRRRGVAVPAPQEAAGLPRTARPAPRTTKPVPMSSTALRSTTGDGRATTYRTPGTA